ncbi:MAG: hypothetical protein HOC23_03750 [Halieaceae bacterium]|jgi:hypothetical protein|nr:hypothetical protein [Halieaceae bacterium]
MMVEALMDDGKIISLAPIITEFGEEYGMKVVDITIVDPTTTKPWYLTIELKTENQSLAPITV